MSFMIFTFAKKPKTNKINNLVNILAPKLFELVEK